MDRPASVMDEILLICPEFRVTWDDEKSLWSGDDGTYSFHGLFSVLSHHVADLLERKSGSPLGPLFDLVERKLSGTDSDLSNAVATCFLENLMNRVPRLFPFASFERFLGPASREFCKAYGEEE